MLKKIKIIVPKKPLNFSESCNAGLKQSKNDYKGIVNDDVVFTNSSLDNVVDKLKDDIVIGPISNCNVGWLDTDQIENVDGIDLVPAMKIDQIKDYKTLYKLGNKFNANKTLVTRSWLAFFATFFNANILEKVGYLDDNFIFDKEDLDWCVRASKLGIKQCQTLDSYIFHFGGISRKNSENENYDQHHKNALISSDYYKLKYSKESVVIWNGPSYQPWDDRNLVSGNIGGSEVWCIQLARELDKLGYRVIVFNDCPNATMKFGEIEYQHWTRFGDWNDRNHIDYFISSRSLEPFKLKYLRAKKKFVMIHDIWLMLQHGSDVNYHTEVDKFFCLSNRHKEFVSHYHGIDQNRILMTSNGIDFNRFIDIDDRKRKRYKAIYTSSPDRGLENLLEIYPRLKERIPKLELHVYYGFDFVKGKDAWVEYMMNKMKELGVIYHGKVNQEELAEAYKTSRVVLAPNHFWETFCITAIEAMAAGCIYLGSHVWGLIDTVGKANPLIEMKNEQDWNTSEEYRKQFIEEAYKLFNDNKYFKKWQNKGYERVNRFGWDKVALQFDRYFQKEEWEEIQ